MHPEKQAKNIKKAFSAPNRAFGALMALRIFRQGGKVGMVVDAGAVGFRALSGFIPSGFDGVKRLNGLY
jgi:hypothetical protein